MIALASPRGSQAGDEATQKERSATSPDDESRAHEAPETVSEPPPSPAPSTSNRASVQRYVESIDPGSWLRRFGDVEERGRR